MTEVREAAKAWHDAGFAVLPTRTDGSKAPAVPAWRDMYKTRTMPTDQQIEGWFSGGHAGLGLLCGGISGNLEMLELEGRAVAEGAVATISELVAATGLGALWIRLTQDGYAEQTPSGGLHLLYRVDGMDVPGSVKLAQRPAREDEYTDDERAVLAKFPHRVITRVLAETRGDGGYVVVAPSNGTTHPTGKAWRLAYGAAGQVPTITADERTQLHRLFRCLDQMPEAEPAEQRTTLAVVRTEGEVSPLDDFERRTDWADDMLLGGVGWTVLTGHPGGYRTWKRLGKDTPGLSGTTGRARDRDRLYVFSTSTEFEAERPLTKPHVYAVLHHRGDHSAAARALRKLGYGTPTPISPDPAADPSDLIVPRQRDEPPATITVVDGTAVRVLAEPLPSAEKFGPTQDGMARALATHHRDVLRYCPQRGKWLHWQGHRWQWDEAEIHREYIKTLARGLPDGDGWARFKASSLSGAGSTGIARQAQTDPRLVAHFDALDSDPWALNTPAGIVDLRTGQLGPADPDALCTRTTYCAPDPGADTGRWEEFLADTFGGDTQLVSYLQRLVGYSAVGVVGAHVLPFAHGSGGNGKGVFLEALAGVLGGYATSAPNGFLMNQPFPSHETEIARLAGARMVICSEVNEEDRFDEAKVKTLTGGDTLTARFMRQDHFTFKPTHQLWLMGNHKPAVRSGGRSFWRRLRLIPFEHEVPEDKIVDDLQGRLMREHGPALMAWIVAGAAAYARGGLAEPSSVKAATDAYELDQDTVAQFVDECCRIGGGPQVSIRIAKVREAYEQFCFANGDKPVTAKALTTALDKRYAVGHTRTASARMYTNLTLLVTEEDERSDEKQGGW